MDGISPVAKVEQTENGAVVTVTDRNGTTTAEVKNGRDGKDAEPYDDTEIKEEVGQLKEDISAKVSGVSVAGIVQVADENNIVDIPKIGTNKYGVVRGGGGAIRIANEYLYISDPPESAIAGRNQYYGITPKVLNSAVTAALTDANHLTMTEAQQKTACETIGAVSKFGWLYRDITLDTDYDSYTIDFQDENGNSVDVRVLKLIASIPPNKSTGGGSFSGKYLSANGSYKNATNLGWISAATTSAYNRIQFSFVDGVHFYSPLTTGDNSGINTNLNGFVFDAIAINTLSIPKLPSGTRVCYMYKPI